SLLQQSDRAPFDKINLSAPKCQVELGQTDLSFSLMDVAGQFQTDASAPNCRLAWRLPGETGGTLCEMTLTRDRRVDPAQTSLVFRTVEGPPLSARVLDCFFDSRDWLGDDGKVEGTLTLQRSENQDWEADFHGDLYNVNLSNLVGKRF